MAAPPQRQEAKLGTFLVGIAAKLSCLDVNEGLTCRFLRQYFGGRSSEAEVRVCCTKHEGAERMSRRSGVERDKRD